MKIRIKNYNGDLPKYLTIGKVYEVTYSFKRGNLDFILDDEGGMVYFMFDSCIYLNGGSWEEVECIEHKFIATTRLCTICGKSKSEFIAEKVKTQQDELKKWKELR